MRSTTQIWVVTRHQYGISAVVSQTSFGGETSGSVTKYGLFSQADKTFYIRLTEVFSETIRIESIEQSLLIGIVMPMSK